MICASYNRELAEGFLDNVKLILDTGWYRDLFPKTKLRKSTATEIKTTCGGSILATSVNATLTGKGADFIIVDDPHNVREAYSDTIRQSTIDWFRTSLITRTNDSAEACFIVVQQRVHPHDLAGYLIEQGGWNHLNLPAVSDCDQSIELGNDRIKFFKKGELLNPSRLSQDVLDQKKREMGSLDFSSQFLQAPALPEGNLIPVAKFRTFKMEDIYRHNGEIIQSWDSAFSEKSSADYSVGTTWLVWNGAYYLLDVYREQGSFYKTKTDIVELARRYQPTCILIESNSVGSVMVSDLRQQSWPVEGVHSSKSKESRTQPCTAQIERGEVYVLEGAPWKETFIEECRAFPKGKHDDQVDSMTLFLNTVREYTYDKRHAEALGQGLEGLAQANIARESLEQNQYRRQDAKDWLTPTLDKKFPGWRS